MSISERRKSSLSESRHVGEHYTLSTELTTALTLGAKQTWKQRVVVSNKELHLESRSCIRTLFCCCTALCSKPVTDPVDAFKLYLSDTYGKFTANRSAELVSVDFSSMATLKLDEVRKVVARAQEIDKRYKDLDNLVKWLRWSKIYQTVISQKVAEPEGKSQIFTPTNTNYVPGERMVRKMSNHEIDPYKFSKIFKRVHRIPLNREISDLTLVCINDAVKIELAKKDCFTVETHEIILIVIHELIKREFAIRTPPDDLIDPKLRSAIEDYDSITHLSATELQALLVKEGDYVTPHQNNHRPTLPSPTINAMAKHQKSFFAAPISDV